MLGVVLDVARELLPGLAAELIFWTRLWQGVNPSQSEIAPIYELGPALSNLQCYLDAFSRAPDSEKRVFVVALSSVLQQTLTHNLNE